MNSVHFSSAQADWATPQAFVDAVARRFCIDRFDLDACATAENHKAPNFICPEEDAMVAAWKPGCASLTGTPWVWMNPPYGRSIGRWTARATEQARLHALNVVALLPARTDTEWWHMDVMRAELVLLVKGRLRFVGAPTCAPFPSAVAFWSWYRLLAPSSGMPPVFRAWWPSAEERGL